VRAYGTNEYAIRGADATTGNLSTFYKGKLPSGYGPMKKEGAIILGSGGDCCYSNTTMSQGPLRRRSTESSPAAHVAVTLDE
jgi:hypothetical protein